jgi:pimeloyl-ACP methyl ester carboxylesterase
MDGSGRLFHTQLKIWKSFDVRCLSIPKNDVSSWKTLTKKVLDLIKKELKYNAKRKVFLCGESFGGCLALKLIEIAPNIFDSLILVNPASSFKQRPLLNLGTIVTEFIPDFVYINSTVILLLFLANLTNIKRRNRQKLLKMIQSIPPPIVSWRLSLLEDFFIDETLLNRFQNSVLIIASGKDQILPSAQEAKRLSKFFVNKRIVLLANNGHSCLLEKDVDLYKIMLEKS